MPSRFAPLRERLIARWDAWRSSRLSLPEGCEMFFPTTPIPYGFFTHVLFRDMKWFFKGTVTCRVLLHWLQATRGMAVWMKALCSKKRRCSQLRRRVSKTGWSAAPQLGHSKRLPDLNAKA